MEALWFRLLSRNKLKNPQNLLKMCFRSFKDDTNKKKMFLVRSFVNSAKYRPNDLTDRLSMNVWSYETKDPIIDESDRTKGEMA